MSDSAESPIRIVLVTGPSGAGRATAINAIEDLGFEAIDNIPLSLVPRLLDGPALTRPLALGIDVRNRQFSPDALLDMRRYLASQFQVSPELLYLDARRDVLLRRYSETRRRHPMAPTEAPSDGIDLEIALLEPVRAASDALVDTSDLTPHDLRERMQELFGASDQSTLAVSLVSFSYKRGLPHGADVVLDCRFLRNPYWDTSLRAKTGLDDEVQAHVTADPRYDSFETRVLDLLEILLPGCQEEGKAHFSVAFGCTGGQHRSVTVAARVAQTLAARGWPVASTHRELERRGLLAQASPDPGAAGQIDPQRTAP